MTEPLIGKPTHRCPQLPRDAVEKAEEVFRRMLGCDSVRLSSPVKKEIFVIAGYLKESRGQWVDQDNKEQNFTYLSEVTVASGECLFRAFYSLRRYVSLKDKTIMDLAENPDLMP